MPLIITLKTYLGTNLIKKVRDFCLVKNTDFKIHEGRKGATWEEPGDWGTRIGK